MDKTTADPLVGRTVAQYEVLAKLGGGGMGVVYKARDIKLGRAVALKFLPPQWSHDEGAKQRFVREAQAASATNHQNICVIHNIDETADGRLFIVMAYYEGETLKQRLERGALSLVEAVDIASEIAEGLAKAHAQGVVHRDVKPGNLMLTDDGVKILDFGLAKCRHETLAITGEDSAVSTQPGTLLGTVGYMSPEQVRGGATDSRSDIFSLGVILHEMIPGPAPFHGDSAVETLHAILKNDPPVLPRSKGVAPALEHVIRHCLEKSPDARFQSARDLAFVLEFMLRAPDAQPPRTSQARGLLASIFNLL